MAAHSCCRAVDLHEPSSSSDHDVLHIWQGLKLGASHENRRIFPYARIAKRVVSSTSICYWFSPVSYASGSGWVAVIHQPLGRPFGRPFEWPFA